MLKKVKYFILILLPIFIILAGVSIPHTVYASSPIISSMTPDGTSFTTSRPTITAHFKDTHNLGTLTTKIDGKVVGGGYINYPGHWEYDDWDEWWVTDDYTAGDLVFSPSLTDGQHTIEVSISDAYGNKSTQTITITVGEPPKINSVSPINGTIIANVTTNITANVTDNGALDLSRTVMKVNGQLVTPTYNSTTHNYSYIPTTPFSNEGTNTVELTVYDTTGLSTSRTWTFGVDANPPVISSMTSDGTSFTTSRPTITAHFKDTHNLGTLTTKIDGKVVGGGYINYPGHWESDDWDEWWVTDDYTAGDLVFSPGLTDGQHTIEVSISDAYGNKSTQTITITVGEPPKINSVSPINGAITKSVTPNITANVTDNEALNLSRTVMKVNGQLVTPIYNNTTHIYSYTPTTPFSNEGNNTVELTVYDTAGLSTSRTWTFGVDANPPVISLMTPDGTSFATSRPTITAHFKDTHNLGTLITIVDGKNVNGAIINYPGHWESDDWDDWWVNDDYTSGDLVFNPIGLTDGQHTIVVKISDTYGNQSSQTITINVAEPPKINSINPINNAVVNSLTPAITANVTDNGVIDVAKTIMKVNGEQVTPTYNNTTHLFSYTPITPLPNENTTKVELKVFDTVGASTTLTWTLRINTYEEMPTPPSDNSKCGACHNVNSHPNGNCGACHYNGGPASGHGDPYCWDCHGGGGAHYISNNCTSCHNNDYYSGIPKAHTDKIFTGEQHKSTETCTQCHAVSLTREHYKYNDPQTNTKITCETCHQNPPSDMATKVRNAIATKNSRCDACHNYDSIVTKHKDHSTTTTFVAQGCTSCHNSNLTSVKEHNPTGNTCTVCHASSKTNVQNAITSKNTDCSTCHTPHQKNDEVHTATFDSKIPVDCNSCHEYALNQEHINKVGSDNKPLNCATCHATDKPLVKIAVSAKATNCSACHEIKHENNINAEHSSTFIDNAEIDCSACHDNSLNNEHAKRLNANGDSLNCNTCHKSTNPDVKNAIGTGVNGNTKCDACHKDAGHKDGVDNAHQTSYLQTLPYDCSSCHKKTLSSEHLAKNLTCATCHGRDVAEKVSKAVKGKNTYCNACHDDYHSGVESKHTSSYVINPQLNCAGCHQNNLYNEHSLYQDANGKSYDCSTCHNSTRPDVITAIATNTTNCDACHVIPHNNTTQVNQEHTLTVSFVSNQTYDCGGCHNQSLSQEHMSRKKADGTNYDCNTCHDNPTTQVPANSSTVLQSRLSALSGPVKTFSAPVNVSEKTTAGSVNCASCHEKTLHSDVNEAHWKQYDYDSSAQCENCHKMHPKN